MASHYDEKAKCRVGTMDEDQFNTECEPTNVSFFSEMIAAWRKAGGTLKWGAGGVSLRGAVDSKDISICFLAPQFAGKKDRIELGCASLTKQIGKDRLSSLEESLRQAAGEQVLGKTMISIVEPGVLPAAKQKALRQAFVKLLG
jgi:hypothetical protein